MKKFLLLVSLILFLSGCSEKIKISDVIGKYIHVASSSTHKYEVTLKEDGTCDVKGFYHDKIDNLYLSPFFDENTFVTKCDYIIDGTKINMHVTTTNKGNKSYEEVILDFDKDSKTLTHNKLVYKHSSNISNNDSSQKLSCTKSDVDNIISQLKSGKSVDIYSNGDLKVAKQSVYYSGGYGTSSYGKPATEYTISCGTYSKSIQILN